MFVPHCSTSLILLWIALLSSHISASTPENRTIDSLGGDSVTGAQPEYIGPWENVLCPTCLQNKTAVSKAFGGGWHEAHSSPTSSSSVSMTFNGTAFYVWCFVPNDNGDTSYNSVFNIALDGTLIYRFNHTSDGTTRLDDTIVYSNESLSNAAHNLSLLLIDGAILFDYIQYTFTGDDSSAGTPSASNPPAAATTTSPKSHTAAIAGGVVAGIVGLALILIIPGVLYRKRKREAIGKDSIQAEPYLLDSSVGERMIVLPGSTPSMLEKGNRRGTNTAAQLHDRGLELDVLQRQQPQSASHRETRSGTTETSSGRDTENTANITNRLDDLRDEIARLEGQQQVIINELHPPPGYNG